MIDTKERFHSINFMKGIAILIVTYFHIFRWLKIDNIPIFTDDLNLIQPFTHSDYGVNLFIFMSGFLLYSSSKKKNFSSFMKSKLIRLSPLYFVAIFFYYIFAVAGYPITKIHNLPSVLLHLTYTHTLSEQTTYSLAGVLWFMGLIIQLYIAGYFLDNISNKNIFIAIFIVIIITIFSYTYDAPFVNFRFFGRYLLIFYLGYIAHRYYSYIFKMLKNKFLFWAYFSLLMAYSFCSFFIEIFPSDRFYHSQIFIYVFFPLFICIIEHLKDCKNAIFLFVSYLGSISYSLFLFNYSFVYVEKATKIFEQTSAGKIHAIIFYSIFLFVMGWAGHQLDKKLQSKLRA